MNLSQKNYGFSFAPRLSSRIPERKLNDLDYADDIALLENCIKMANLQLAELSQTAAIVGLEINVNKTKYMSFNIEHADLKES